MWNKPNDKKLAVLPQKADDKKGTGDKVVYMHFFIGGCDWYATEWYPAEDNFFGFAILNGDLQNAEWGYFSLQELDKVGKGGFEIDFDKYWKVRPAKEVEKIVQAGGVW